MSEAPSQGCQVLQSHFIRHLTQEDWSSLQRATPVTGLLAGNQVYLNSQDRRSEAVQLADHRRLLAEGMRTRNPKTGLPPGSLQTRGTVTTDVSSSHTHSMRPCSPCGISGQGSCFHAPAMASFACRTASSGMFLLQTILSVCLYRLADLLSRIADKHSSCCQPPKALARAAASVLRAPGPGNFKRVYKYA